MLAAGLWAGGDDEETKQETTIPEASPEEKQLQGYALGMIEQYMKQSGYDITETQVEKNPGQIKAYEDQLANLNAQLPTATGKQRNQLQSQIDDITNKLTEERANVKTDYTFNLNETGKKLEAQREVSLDRQKEIDAITHTNAMKFLNGDYSITEGQKKWIDDNIGSMRGPIMAMLDEAKGEAEKTGQSMINILNNDYIKSIKDSGLSVGAAINAIDDRIRLTKEGVMGGIGEEEKRLADTGMSVKAALQGVRDEIDKTQGAALGELENLFTIRRTLAKRDLEDYYQDTVRQTATQAAQFGRSYADPQFQQQIMDKMARKIETLNLELGETEAMQKIGIITSQGAKRESVAGEEAAFTERQGRTGEGLGAKRTAEEAAAGGQLVGTAAERAALAERTGAQLTEAEKIRMGIAESTGAKKEAIAGQKAQTEATLQSEAGRLREQFGYGIPASSLGIGMNVGQYNAAIQQQGLANTAAAANIGTGQQSAYLQERMAQPTTTTTKSGGTFGAVMGALGTAAAGAGAVMGGAGALMNPAINAVTSAAGGGGSTTPTFIPAFQYPTSSALRFS